MPVAYSDADSDANSDASCLFRWHFSIDLANVGHDRAQTNIFAAAQDVFVSSRLRTVRLKDDRQKDNVDILQKT